MNPLTIKCLRRFRRLKRAYVSFWILIGLYILSLGAELVCNGSPLWIRYEGRSYFPIFRFYPDNVFTASGKFTRPDYKQIARSERFRQDPANRMLFAPIPYGPLESVPFESIKLPDQVSITLEPAPLIGTLTIRPDLTIAQESNCDPFLGTEAAANDAKISLSSPQSRPLPSGLPHKMEGEAVPRRQLDDTLTLTVAPFETVVFTNRSLTDLFLLPEPFRKAVADRFANRAAPSLALTGVLKNGKEVRLSVATFTPRRTAPATVRVTLREPGESALRAETVRIDRDHAMGREARPRSAILDSLPFSNSSPSGGTRSVASVFSSSLNHDQATTERGPPFPNHPPLEERVLSRPKDDLKGIWRALAPADRQALLDLARVRFGAAVAETNVNVAGRNLTVRFGREEVRYPMRPVRGHPFGIDSAGRDVLARILYGLRISLSFGLLLVVVTMGVGILVGAFQGYYGGMADIVGQRLIEIWDALPFLYILILMGSVFGSSFGLLLLCYGLFNWVGISYYQRGEFLRLRRLAFVESAQCMGIAPLTIMFRHILPNAMAPVITFFPFSLVGAIGLLAALDYLGFGLPPPTPSWGELLTQAQEYSWAWWLALYPALALFVVMLLGVFIGEGVRAAFDPRPVSRME